MRLKRILALLLILGLFVPPNWLPAFARSILTFLYIIGVVYLVFWIMSTLMVGFIERYRAHQSKRIERSKERRKRP